MKQILLALIIACVVAGTSGVAEADLISFINTGGDFLQGVDGDTSSWAVGDGINMAIGPGATAVSYWSLLGGTAGVYGFAGTEAATLTHRGTRGLGILGGIDDDEIDSFDGVERLVFDFDQAQYINSFEVRSFFNDESIEQAVVEFYYGGSLTPFYTQNIQAQEAHGGNGVASFLSGTALPTDRLDFYVPLTAADSEFAVAKLDVNAVPEPISCTLFVIGGISLISFSRKRRR